MRRYPSSFPRVVTLVIASAVGVVLLPFALLYVAFTVIMNISDCSQGGGPRGLAPSEGDTCKGARVFCLNETSALYCDGDGRWRPMPCTGCVDLANTEFVGSGGPPAYACQWLADESGPCPVPGAAACTPDHKHALVCGADRKFGSRQACIECSQSLGPSVHCHRVESDGEPCGTDGDLACDRAGDLLLRCDGRTMRPIRACLARPYQPYGCNVQREVGLSSGLTSACNDAELQAGGECGMEGKVACSADLRSTLRCEQGKFVAMDACASGCLFDPSTSKYRCQ